METARILLAEAEKPRSVNTKSVNIDKPIWYETEKGANYNDYLIYLYQNSPKHGSLIKSKVKYICGNGYLFNPKVNAEQKLNQLLKDTVICHEIYNCFYFELIRDAKQLIREVRLIPNRHVVKNKDNTKFWYCIDPTIKSAGANLVPFVLYGEENPTNQRELFYYSEFDGSFGLYPAPLYVQGINYIASDCEVAKHTFTNARQGFKATKHITLTNGNPTEEIKDLVKRKFSNTYSGESGENLILDFVTKPEHKTIIDDLGQSDLVRENYETVDELIRSNIFTAHEVTTPELFGVAVPGKLGGLNNLREGYQIFSNVYVKHRRESVHQQLMIVLKDILGGQMEAMLIQPIDPIGILADFTTALEKNEVRELLGYEPIESQSETLNILNSLSPLVATKVLEAMSGNEIRALCKLPLNSKATFKFSLDDSLTIFSEFGFEKSEAEIYVQDFCFSITKSDVKNILELLQDQMTEAKIAKELDLSINEVVTAIDKLEQAGKIERTANGVKIIDKPNNYSIAYSYEWRKEIPLSERDSSDHPSRVFCKKLMALNKYYSRTDIEKISAKLGYSVFDRQGGWWNDKGLVKPSCRHQWQATILKK